MISVVIPVHNAARTLRQCLESVVAQSYPHECIVVNDGSTDDSVTIARSYPVSVVDLRGGPFGPAYARNRGAEAARGDLVFFVDADVVLPPSTLNRLAATFAQHPEIDAVFGSYDDRPGAVDFLSQYRNLLHHYVHQQAKPEAMTFWGACGAVRRSVFLRVGGFDEERYPRPSIEDIELGYRLRANGHMIRLDKEMQVQHLKRWTLWGMIKTDIFDRAIPWTHLILEKRGMPNDLSLHVSNRVSAMLIVIMVFYLGTIAFFLNARIAPVLAAPILVLSVLIVFINYRLYAFFASKRSPVFMFATVPFHWLYHLYSAAGFALGTAFHVWQGLRVDQKDSSRLARTRVSPRPLK
jgi:glycosyltransferase involved in cell wall biosynthesis